MFSPLLAFAASCTFDGDRDGQSQSTGSSELIKEALFIGRKIAAIKLYRQQTNVGLAEAKAAVEK